MTSRDFCFWLQGYLELASADGTPVLSQQKTESIQKHLNLVFKHEIDPSFGDKDKQDLLNKIHGPGRKDDVLLRC